MRFVKGPKGHVGVVARLAVRSPEVRKTWEMLTGVRLGSGGYISARFLRPLVRGMVVYTRAGEVERLWRFLCLGQKERAAVAGMAAMLGSDR